jgi:two-component system phosphate regulon sensor histidine kinase PhoR
MVQRKRLLWKVAPPYLVIMLLAVIATGWLSARTLRDFFLERIRNDLELRAQLALRDLPSSFPDNRADSLEQISIRLKKITGARITLIAMDGRVLGDSDADPKTMENHTSHPEVGTALTGQPSFDVRYSITVRRNMMYFAMPVRKGMDVVGVLRTALPLTMFEDALRELIGRIIFGAVIVALIAAVVTFFLSRRISSPIIGLVRGAERYATGDLSREIAIPDTEELASLAETLNNMAAELDRRLRELTEQRNEQESVLASMGEGVIAVGMDERILFMNRTAQELLSVDGKRAKGRLLQEYVRSSELQQFIGGMLESHEVPAPREISLPSRENHVLQVNGTFLKDSADKQLGALVVLNDITRLRQLEGMRKEFVANVSHELKTPITSIKGFVDTLREGALDDKEYARGFLERIGRNADRLNSIIDDLLKLSRIERDVSQEEVMLEPFNLNEVVQAAISACAVKAEDRNIRIVMNSPGNVQAPVDPTLLEQAVINLLDNAIKYSDPGQQVEVDVERADVFANIRVRDHGCGIGEEHFPRLFERFYRVDKARSRKLGGTGLGLAIVKHIALAHRGQVSVESVPGEGSVFTISIPLA